MSGMSSGAPYPVQRCARISDKRNSSAFLGTAYRNHRRVTRSDEWTDNETLWRVLGKGVRDTMRALREGRMFGLQECSYGHSEKRNCPN